MQRLFWDARHGCHDHPSRYRPTRKDASMQLCTQSQIELKPMLLGRNALGGQYMPQLRFHPAVEEQTDAIPFPGRVVSRIGRWQPRIQPQTPQVHEAEQALEEVNRHLGRLAELLDNDDDRPRAA